MKLHHRITVLLLALMLCAVGSSALAAGLEDPEGWLGTWEGGEDYGEARDYYLYLLDYHDGVFDAALELYRLWSFDGMTALLSQETPSAVLSTSAFDDFSVLGTLDFSADGIALLILESDYPDLPAGTEIQLERSKD